MLFLIRLTRSGCRLLNRELDKRTVMSRSNYRHYSGLVDYQWPEWVTDNIPSAPKHKVQLAHANTPIHKWNLPGLPDGVELYIKRDDMTGSTLSGNKVRKLEFLLADAMKKGCKHVITCGGIQSNHCRTTAISTTQIGLKPHLVLRENLKSISDIEWCGNVFLDHLSGADLYFAPKYSPQLTHLFPRMRQLAKKIKSDTGEDSYLICVGGSDEVGMFGYISAFQELISQEVLENFSDIILPCGSGGTTEGLAVGNFLTGSKLRVHGVIVSDNKQCFEESMAENFTKIGLKNYQSVDNLVDLIEGHKGKSYGPTDAEGLSFIEDVARNTGIMLDPVYTGKACLGLVKELSKNPERFKGKRLLFIHTGGIYGMYDGSLQSRMKKSPTNNVTVKLWPEIEKPPF